MEITTILTAKTSVRIHTYLYDQEDIVQEIITKPRPRRDIVETTSFVHGPGIDEPLAFSGPQGEYFFHADGLGSISALTDHTGAVVQRYEYSTFGIRKKYDTGADTFYSYTGREWDSETGLYYYRSRYYDPQAGRFISRDPIGFAGGDVNVYRYVQNNPVNAIDPKGLALIYNGSGTGIPYKPEHEGNKPPSMCDPGDLCNADGVYSPPGSGEQCATKIPDNCAAYIGSNGKMYVVCGYLPPIIPNEPPYNPRQLTPDDLTSPDYTSWPNPYNGKNWPWAPWN